VDANSGPDTRQVLSDWSKKDRRLKIKYLDENKGIAGNSNEAVMMAGGIFVGFLDHDDLLAPFALYEVVHCLQFNKDVDVIYSDEDKINENGTRFDPFFKPDFSPDYLRSVNYISHFLVMRKALGDQVGWFREGYEGAQDYDLILRAAEKARRIAHIPKILHHWRAWTGSTAIGADAKPYANTSGKKALQDHLNRIGLPARVEDGYASTFYREYYSLSRTPLLSIIIPSQDHVADLERCIDSILQKTTYPNFEVVIIENNSKKPETFKLYERFIQDSRISILNWDEPFNYSRINNWAAGQVKGEVLLFLNNDTQVINEGWLEEMLSFAIRSDIGAVGAKLYYPDDSIQHAGVIVGVGGVAGHSHKYFPKNDPGYFGSLISVHNVSAVTAACLMVRKQVFQEVNGFDEDFILAFGDVDLCLRILLKGYLNIWTPYAELYHHESMTRGGEDDEIKQRRFKGEIDHFKQRWNDFLQKGDPYYNPNLTLDREDFSIELRKNVHPSQLVREPISPISST
jgi:GT2 family glycosyltransferase